MPKKSRFITAGGTLVCALGIGYLMQANANTPAPAVEVVHEDKLKPQATAVEAATLVADPDPVKTAGVVAGMADLHLVSAKPVPPKTAPQPETMPSAPIILAALSVTEQAIPELPQEEPTPRLQCEITMEARPAAAAMVTLELSAPCMKNERLTLHHNGIMISEVTDMAGKLSATMPALSKDAVFIAAFANGEATVASAEVTALEYYDRMVLQWEGDTGLQIHALEYGAAYGGPGHVWSGASGDIASAANGEGGFVTRFGAADLDHARLAEVYTFPTRTAARGGDVRLSVEAEVTPLNCGRDIEAQSFRVSNAGRVDVRDLTLAIPDCEAAGDFLVLKNLFNDLKIARN